MDEKVNSIAVLKAVNVFIRTLQNELEINGNKPFNETVDSYSLFTIEEGINKVIKTLESEK